MLVNCCLFPDLVELEEFFSYAMRNVLSRTESPRQDKELSQGPSNLVVTVKTRICPGNALSKARLSDKTDNLKWRF